MNQSRSSTSRRKTNLDFTLPIPSQTIPSIPAGAMRLRHLHLPHHAPSLYPPYSLASRVQEHLRRRQLDFKDATSSIGNINANTNTKVPPPPPGTPPGVMSAKSASSLPRPPPPVVMSFSPLPTFTLGRRQTAPLTEAERTRLQAPLYHYSPTPAGAVSPTAPPPPPPLPVSVIHSPRGGLATYHGPGQIVLWPVLDLKAPHHKHFTVRCYSRLLEDTTIATLRTLFGLSAFTTEDPGVWVLSRSSHSAEPDTDGAKHVAKIAALGVHLRRHVSALGTAINIAMPGTDVTAAEINPWARIVACGLEGKTVTSAAAEVPGGLAALDRQLAAGGAQTREEAVSASWAEELARRIAVDGVDTLSRQETARLLADVLAQGEGGEATAEEKEYVMRLQAV